jgi:hypothetical protein
MFGQPFLDTPALNVIEMYSVVSDDAVRSSFPIIMCSFYDISTRKAQKFNFHSDGYIRVSLY